MDFIPLSKFLRELPQYHYDRDVFVNVFKQVFSINEICDLEVACQEHRSLANFLLYYAEDEFYIIHLPSGTMINWYKHLGRCNTCNNEAFSTYDLLEFLVMLKYEITDSESEDIDNA